MLNLMEFHMSVLAHACVYFYLKYSAIAFTHIMQLNLNNLGTVKWPRKVKMLAVSQKTKKRQKGLNHLCQLSSISINFDVNILELMETNALNSLTRKSYRGRLMQMLHVFVKIVLKVLLHFLK